LAFALFYTEAGFLTGKTLELIPRLLPKYEILAVRLMLGNVLVPFPGIDAKGLSRPSERT
jgi:hypothetical protein